MQNIALMFEGAFGLEPSTDRCPYDYVEIYSDGHQFQHGMYNKLHVLDGFRPPPPIAGNIGVTHSVFLFISIKMQFNRIGHAWVTEA